MTTVMNLRTQEKYQYSCKPKDAVIACYAQSLGDFNTWEYNYKYSYLVEEGRYTYLCGDFSVLKEEKSMNGNTVIYMKPHRS